MEIINDLDFCLSVQQPAYCDSKLGQEGKRGMRSMPPPPYIFNYTKKNSLFYDASLFLGFFLSNIFMFKPFDSGEIAMALDLIVAFELN